MKSNEKNFQNKREEKKLVNIKWNSRFFFQLGLIVSLLVVFFVMESTVGLKVNHESAKFKSTLEEPPFINYVLEDEKPRRVENNIKKTEPKPQPQKVLKSNDFEPIKNDFPTIDDIISGDNAPIEPDLPTVVDNAPPTNKVPSNIMNVEFVPVFPGCETMGTKSEKIACMSSKINVFINKNFRQELLENLPSNQSQRIYVQFKIGTDGYVTDVVANSNNPLLKNEAQRVINKLPIMQPGKQGDTKVEVLYTVPIVFRIQ